MNEVRLLAARVNSSIYGRYQTILCDPPWQYDFTAGDGVAENHYKTMSPAALAALPVRDLSAPDCALFMWATWPTLPDAFEVGKAWGFTYKTAAWVWVKQTSTGRTWHWGTGFWSRSNTEVCLLFTRGAPKRQSMRVHQLIVDAGQLTLFPAMVQPRTSHSAKPYETYSRIEALVPGPYLELFARNAAPGWDAWGLEAPNCIDWRPAMSRVA